MDINDKEMLYIDAKTKLEIINTKIKELSETLDILGYEYEMNLETIDYSTIKNKKTYIQLNVTLKKDLPSCVVNDYE